MSSSTALRGNDGTAPRFSTKPAQRVRHRATSWIENQACKRLCGCLGLNFHELLADASGELVPSVWRAG
jgi:hypothetical protein